MTPRRTVGDAGAVDGMATRLADEFDDAFARPRPEPDPPGRRMLVAMVAGDRYLIPVEEVARVVTGRGRVPVPSPPAGLLGVTGLSGEVVPVWSLATLLGRDHPDDGDATVRLAGAPAVAVALDRVVDQVETRVSAALEVQGNQPLCRGAIRLDGVAVPVVSADAVRGEIRRRCGHAPIAAGVEKGERS